jgi:hypothetical protein
VVADAEYEQNTNVLGGLHRWQILCRRRSVA